jgi:hypothetical protein
MTVIEADISSILSRRMTRKKIVWEGLLEVILTIFDFVKPEGTWG